nr:importin subunit alpha-like [Ipomoea trifida]
MSSIINGERLKLTSPLMAASLNFSLATAANFRRATLPKHYTNFRTTIRCSGRVEWIDLSIMSLKANARTDVRWSRYKVPVDAEDGQRRREENMVEIRRNKREENLHKKRRYLV